MICFPKTKCCVAACNKFASFKCECSTPSIYSCPKHIEKHRLQSANTKEHPISFTPSLLLQGQAKDETLKKLTNIKKKLKECKAEAIAAGNQLIATSNASLKKLLTYIQSEIINVLNIRKFILKDQHINSELLNALDDVINTEFKTENIKEEISEIFSYNNLKSTFDYIEDKILFAKDDYPHCMVVDLKTLDINYIGNNSNYWSGAAACAINNEEYFINGGGLQSYYHGNCGIINLKNNSFEMLFNDSQNFGHSCVFEDEFVYSFGGYPNNSSQKFNLKTKLRSALPNFPGGQYTSSTSLGRKIIIASNTQKCIYIFDDNAYSKNLRLNLTSYCWVNKDWIISNNVLYRCQNLQNLSWEKYNINFICRNDLLPINHTYLRGKYIYIITKSNYELWRIDTVSKSVESLKSLCSA